MTVMCYSCRDCSIVLVTESPWKIRDSDLLAEQEVNLLLCQGNMLNCKWEPYSNTHGCFSNDPIHGKAFSPFLVCKEIALHGATHLLSEWASSLIPRMYKQLLYHSEVSFSIQFSHSVMSNSLRPHGLQHTRLPCPSPTPRTCSNSCPLNQWYHPAILSSVVPFSSCLQSFPASGSFLMSQFFASHGQSIGASASASVLPMNIQDWFLLRLTG